MGTIWLAATAAATVIAVWRVCATPRRLRVEPRREAAGKHPARRRVPGRPVDGWPLDDRERRILGRVEMDALIDVPEPGYTGRRQP